MKVKLFLLVVVLYVGSSCAQNYKFGKVSKEELQEQFFPQDSSAVASVLYEYKNVSLKFIGNQFVLSTEVYKRIKLYKKEGLQYANHKFFLYQPSGVNETVSGIKGATYNLENSNIEKTKLKNSGIFDEVKNKYYKQYTITMPAVKAGSVIEYKYTIESPYSTSIDEFVFQREIPTKKLVAKFSRPEYYDFKSHTRGYLPINKVTTTSKNTITVKTKLAPTKYEIIRWSEKELTYIENIDNYNLENIPALKEEPFTNNINNYRAGVKYELSSTKMPNNEIKTYAKTWEDVTNTIYSNDNFGSQLNKTAFFKDDVKKITQSLNTNEEKIKAILTFVKNKVKWNGFYSKYCDKGVKKAYKEGVGNVAEINLLLTAMLRASGLNANPILVSTKDNGIPLYPSLKGYNYVISGVELNNKVVLLDATDKYSDLNVLPVRALNWRGRIIRDYGSSTFVNLYPNFHSEHNVILIANLDELGEIKGKVKTLKNGYEAISFNKKYSDRNIEEKEKSMSKPKKGLKVTNLVQKELNKPSKVEFTFDYKIDGDDKILNNKIYFKPLQYLAIDEAPFKLEKRDYPVDLVYPFKDSYNVNLKIPDGYKVEYMPKSENYMLPENMGNFMYKINVAGNRLQLFVKIQMNQPFISTQNYASLKIFFDEIVEKEAENVILIKA